MTKTLVEFIKHKDGSVISIATDAVVYITPVYSDRKTFDSEQISLGTDIMLQGGIRIHVVEEYSKVRMTLDTNTKV